MLSIIQTIIRIIPTIISTIIKPLTTMNHHQSPSFPPFTINQPAENLISPSFAAGELGFHGNLTQKLSLQLRSKTYAAADTVFEAGGVAEEAPGAEELPGDPWGGPWGSWEVMLVAVELA